MSACQSSGSHAGAGACAPGATLTQSPTVMSLPEGAEPIKITASVIEKVGEMIAEDGSPGLALRIFVTGGGCSGFQYGFAFDDEKKADDLRVERGAVTVVVDSMSLQYLMGAEIDYEDKLEGARFVIRNPNAASSCGCGSSFSV